MKTRITALLGILFLASTTFAGNTPSNNDLKDLRLKNVAVTATGFSDKVSINDMMKTELIAHGATPSTDGIEVIGTITFDATTGFAKYDIKFGTDRLLVDNYTMVNPGKTDMQMLATGTVNKIVNDYATRLAKRNSTNGATRNGAGGSPKQ